MDKHGSGKLLQISFIGGRVKARDEADGEAVHAVANIGARAVGAEDVAGEVVVARARAAALVSPAILMVRKHSLTLLFQFRQFAFQSLHFALQGRDHRLQTIDTRLDIFCPGIAP